MFMQDKELKAQLPLNYKFSPIYRLRWRFDFNGKNTKYGGWNSASTNPRDMAAFVNKEGLVRASIEGEKIKGYALKTFVEIQGSEYVSCSWIMAASLPVFNAGRFTTSGAVIGMAMFTETEVTKVFVDGQVFVQPILAHEQKTSSLEHKLGSK